MSIMETLLILVILAAITEAIWEGLKLPFGPAISWLSKKLLVEMDKVGALFIGVVVCVLAEVDMFSLVGLEFANLEVVGPILTGLLIGRGSNAVHDLISSLQSIKDRKESETYQELVAAKKAAQDEKLML